MLAGDHKIFYRIQHPEIYLLDLKVQYKHKMRLPLDMVSIKRVLSYLCLPDYVFTYKKFETVTSLNVSDRIVLSSSEDKELKDNKQR